MNPTFTFFGSSRFSVIVLDILKNRGLLPNLIITTPDKPQGRKMILTPNVVKTWATEHNILVYTPQKFDTEIIETLKNTKSDLFVVASYGKILPSSVIDIPARKTLNIHPSLLPQYRGASPLQSAILNDTKVTGITVMQIDEQMDHGPIVAQKNISVPEWPIYDDFEEMMAREGANLLAEILPDWVASKIQAKEQDHSSATYTKKIAKEDALLDLAADPYQNFRKVQAYCTWPVAYVMHEHAGKQIRVKITAASFSQGKLILEKVIPEGSNEMSYTDFVRGYGHLTI